MLILASQVTRNYIVLIAIPEKTQAVVATDLR